MIRGRFEWISLTWYGIFRNKRRTFAMISGIILGVTILTSIFLYSSVLKQQNFESVIEGAAYEIRFDIVENETLSKLQDLADTIQADSHILDTTIIAREPSPTMETQYQTIVTIDGDKDEDSEIPAGAALGTGSTIPIFVQDNFFETEIGKKLSRDLSGTTDLNGNKTIISRSMASKYQIDVGSIIDELNITYNKLIVKGQLITAEEYKGSLTNVLVTGIYEEVAGDAGIFGTLFSVEELYFSIKTLEKIPDIKEKIEEENGYLIAAKIEASQFTVNDPEEMNNEINQFINYIAKNAEKNQMEVDGNNEIEILLLPFQISNVFINIFDVLLAAPVVILSLYLLFFGIEMSLEERKREIAIKKVQGADSKQIFGELRNESFLLFIIGLVIGYILGIFGAWVISSAVGFMQVKIGTQAEFRDFFKFDKVAIIWSVAVVGGILVMQILRQGKSFIKAEVSEAVQTYEGKKESFMKRNNIDVILLLIGVLGIILSLLEHEFGINLRLGLLGGLIINGLGPFFLWIGGAMVGARVTKYVPLKFEKIFLSIPTFKDISRIVRSGLRRRGDTNRLAIIIVLTLSIATLAAAQGNTELLHVQRNIQWEIGSDFQIEFSQPADYTSNITALSSIDDAYAITKASQFKVLVSEFSGYSFDTTKELNNMKNGKSIGIWHEDSFTDMTSLEAMQAMVSNKFGVFVSRNSLSLLNAGIGEKINLKVYLGGVIDATTSTIEGIEILGTYDHAPGGIRGGNFLMSNELNLRIQALADNKTLQAYDGLTLNSSIYLANSVTGYEISDADLNSLKADLAQMNNFNNIRSLYEELNSDATKIGSFGVSGLLSLNFLVAVSASLISTFAFSAIIMERRRREFAVLRAIGARKSQIYKLALGENTMMVVTAVVWGSIIGLGITYQFNGVFELFAVFLGGGPLNRIVEFPFLTVSIIGILTTLGMLIATMISIRSAANQDLSTATRVI